MKVSAPIELSTGRIVLHRRMANGAQEAYFTDDSAMTEAEWEEYCAKVRKATEAAGGTFVQ